MRQILSTLAAVAVLAAPAALRAQTFDFETTPIGWNTPFSVTTGGLTANFSNVGTGAPGSFQVNSAFFQTLTGRVLYDADFVAGGVLQILFDRPLTTVSLRFALNTANAATAFSMTVLNGATTVATTSAVGVIPGNGFSFPEGQIAFTSATAFDRVQLSTAAVDFAIDDVTVRQAQVVPEPATVALLGAGVVALGVGGAWRRRRAA